MNYKEIYNQWLNDEFFDETIHEELKAIKDEKEIEDRFYRNLEFGTGGLRCVMGAGTNRMNKYTVGKITMGFGQYLLDNYGVKECRSRGVAIGYDTRNNSEFFSKMVANVLSGMGIRVYLDANPRPTPQLSFSVKFWNALAGIVVTASHNSKEYNGYKIYDEFGCQLVPRKAEQVINYINNISDYHMIKFDGDDSLIFSVDVTDNYVRSTLKQSRYSNITAKQKLKIVYTPLHGTGNIPVQKALKLDGFMQLETVESQIEPDGDFPTVLYPNPEDGEALKLGIIQAEHINADIVLGTDPDSDRVGIAVKTDNGYQLMTGNQVGALLTKYILTHTDLCKYRNPAIIKTVVSSDLGADIARRYGVTVFSTLTGFKFIGEKITQFEQAKLEDNKNQNYDFLFGYEESYGYLIGTHARDKDAVVSALLICEMAAEAKSNGKTLLDEMIEIYDEYGYYGESLETFTLKGKDGLQKINSIMVEMRNSKSLFNRNVSVIDYSTSIKAEKGFGTLPISNLLKYIFEDEMWVAIRPSGTEPKIKIYYGAKGTDKEATERKLREIQNIIHRKLKLEK